MQRKVYIDFLKVIAIFLVLFMHTNAYGFVLFTQRRDSVLYPVYLTASVLTKVAVPLFFMTSGALLLKREEEIKQILKKRFLRYLISLLVFSSIVYLYKFARGRGDLSLSSFAVGVYEGKIDIHFWYLYMYLSYILTLPFLRILAKNMRPREYRWLFILYIIISCKPIFEFFVCDGKASLSHNINLFTSLNYVAYPLIGYFIDNAEVEEKNVVKWIALGALSVAITALLTHCKCVVTTSWDESSCQTFYTSLIIIPAGSIFYTSKWLFVRFGDRINERTKQLIAALGGLTFGIYLLEYVYRDMTMRIFFLMEPFVGSFIACVIWILISCIYGGAVTYTLKNIPLIKELL